MAKITMTLEADGPEDLYEALAGLCDRFEGGGVFGGGPQSELTPEEQADADHAAMRRTDDDQGEQNGGGKRRRRTKAELEADPAWRAKNGLPPLPNSASSAVSNPAGSSSAVPAPSTPPAAAPSSAPGKALFGIGAGQAQPQITTPQDLARAGLLALPGDAEAAFKAAFRQSMSTRGAKATQDILVKVAGVRMTAEVKPEQYAAVTAAFLAA